MSFGLQSAAVFICFVFKITSSSSVTAQICPHPDGIYVVQEDCTSFLRCEGGKSQIVPCPRNLSFNPHKLTCDYNAQDNCITKTGSAVHVEESPVTDEHRCPDEGSSIEPSSNSCSEYYRCVNGTAYKEMCPDGLLMSKLTLTCDYADKVSCDVFRQRKLLQDDDAYDYDLVDDPQEVVTVSSVSEGEDPYGVPEGGDSVNAAGSEDESPDLLEKSEENEDVSENPENIDSVNAGKNEDVSFTDILLPTATSLKNTFETTTDVPVTTKMQSSKTELIDNKTVESEANVLPATVNAEKSNNPSLLTEKDPASSTLSYDKTVDSSPNPTPSSGTTIPIQVESSTDSLLSQTELQYSTTLKPNINDQTNKTTVVNLVSENEFVSTKQDTTGSSAITSAEFKTESKGTTTTHSLNNTQGASEYVQTTYTAEGILTSTEAYTVEVLKDDVSDSLNANDDSYDIVSDAETTSEILTKKATNTTMKPMSNATSESVFYSTAKSTTVPSTALNNTTNSYISSDTYKVNITTEKSAESVSTASSLDYASEMKELSSNATEQTKTSTNEYISNTDVFQTTTMILANLSSETTDNSVETSSIQKDISSEKFYPEKTTTVISTDTEDINKTLIPVTTESSQQTTFEYKNTTAGEDFSVSSTTLNPVPESIYGKLENETSSQNETMDKSPTIKPTTGPPLSMTATNQQFNDITTTVSPAISDKFTISVVTPAGTSTELTEFTTIIKGMESTSKAVEAQEKQTDVPKDSDYSSIQNDVKDELSSTKTDRQLSSEITIATDTKTSSLETTTINEQTTDVTTTTIGEYANVETATKKYQNDSSQTTISEQMSSVEPTTANNKTSNLIIDVTENQTGYEFKSDIPTTTMNYQKDIVTTSTINDKTSTMEAIKIYDQITRTQSIMPDDKENSTEISTYVTEVTNRETTMPELKSVGTTLTETQTNSLETRNDNTPTGNVDASAKNKFTSDVQTTPMEGQNDSTVTMSTNEQTLHVETSPTHDPITDEFLSSVYGTSITAKHGYVPTHKTMEYFSTTATSIIAEQTMNANSSATEQREYNEETTETEKKYSTTSTKDSASSTLTTETWGASDVITTEQKVNNMEITSVEKIPLSVYTSETEDHTNVTEIVSVKEQTDNFQTTAIEYSLNEEVVTTVKNTNYIATSKTADPPIPIVKSEDTTRQKIASTDKIETTVGGEISTMSDTTTEKSQTTLETSRDEQEKDILSSMSTVITEEELNTRNVTGTESELMNDPSTTEKEVITTQSMTKEMLTTLPTRKDDMEDINTLTSVEKSSTVVTTKTRDYLSSVVTAATSNVGITVIKDDMENGTDVPAETEHMISSSTTEENLTTLSGSTIKEKLDDVVTATIDQDLSSLGTFTATDKLSSVTFPLTPVVTTEKYESRVNTIMGGTYTTTAEYALKTDKFSTNIGSTLEDSTESTVTTRELSSETTTKIDEQQNNDVSTSKEYLKHTITSTTDKNLDTVVTSATEKPSISTDSLLTDKYTRNRDTFTTEKNYITSDTTKTEVLFTDIDKSTTEQSLPTAAKESSSRKTTDFYEHSSTIKTETQNYSSGMDSATVGLYSNNIFSTTRDQLSSLSETTDVEELSSLKVTANTEQTSNTETVKSTFDPYTTQTDNQLGAVTTAKDKETSFFTTEKFSQGVEDVKTTRENYPSSIDPITTDENPTAINSITTEEYPSRIYTIHTEKYPNSIKILTTKTNPGTIETTTSSTIDINADEYSKNVDTITTKKYASINTIVTEEYTSTIDTISTEKYPSSINSITTKTYPVTIDSITTSSSIDNTNTKEYPRNIDTMTTETYTSVDVISTDNPSSIYSINTEKYSSNLDAITTDKYPRSVSTETYTSNIDTNTSEEYVSGLTTTVERNNNSEMFSDTDAYSSSTLTSVSFRDPSSVKTTVEDEELKYTSLSTVDKYPSTVDFTTTEEHFSNMDSVATKNGDINEDAKTETYSNNITITGNVNYTQSFVTNTNMEPNFIVPASTAKDQLSTIPPTATNELNNEITTLAEEHVRKTDTVATEEQSISTDSITTTKYPLNVYLTTEKQLSTGKATTLEKELSTSTEQPQNKSEITVTEEEFKDVSTAFESTSNSITESTLTYASPRESRIENSTKFDYSFSNKILSTETDSTTKSIFPDDQNANYCNGGDGIFPYNNNCSKFVRCFNGSPYFLSCPEGLYYNATKRTCDFNGDCGSDLRVPSSRNLQINCECENCLYPDAGDCARYYVCLNGSAYDMQCSDGLQFNPDTSSCDYEGKVTCTEPSEECPTPNGYIKDSENCSRYFHCVGGISYRKTCEGEKHFNEVTKQCDEPCSAGCDSYACVKASTLLPSPVCQDGDKFYPHPENCNAFYTCSNGRAEPAFCSDDEHFSPTARMCQEPCKAMCDRSLDCFRTTEGVTNSTEIIPTGKDASSDIESTTKFTFTSPSLPTTEDETTVESSTSELPSTNDASTNAISVTSEADSSATVGITSEMSSEYPSTLTTELTSIEPTTISSICNSSDGFYPKPGDCSSFIECTSGISTERKCDRHLHFSPRTTRCEYPCFAECDPTIDCSTTESPDLPTHQPLNLCPKRDILPGKKCERYINCTGDTPFTRRCPVGLHFNPTTRVCDWPVTAGCGKSSSYPDVDNYYKCPCETCIIPSVENCAKYHLCIGYVAYTAKCSEGLLFDNTLNTCNQASKVKCEEYTRQSTTTLTPSSTVSTTEKATTAAETYKCSTKEGYFQKSDDCGKFIQCANWRPYVMKCPSNLHFSMKTLRCEYPCDAKCDLNLACSNTSKSGTADKICVCLNCKVKDPESCTNYFECKNGKARKLFCHRGQTFDSERGICDWAHKVKCHSQTCPKMNGLFPHRDNCRKFLHCANGIPYINECHNNWEFDPVALRCSWPTGRCGSTTASPSTLKPQTKALQDFECPKNFGVFRDEQNCSRFYHCSHGTAFAKECPEGLAFNPKSQTCDWKKNVKCDSNKQYYYQRRCRVYDRHTTCPQSHVNIPHSNCDMFFDCSSGSACGKRCPVGLYFNSTTAVCDRPENVQCPKGKNEVYSLKEFAKVCYETGEGYMNDPALSHCFYRCHHETVIRGCCPRNAVYNEKKDKCEIQRRKLFF